MYVGFFSPYFLDKSIQKTFKLDFKPNIHVNYNLLKLYYGPSDCFQMLDHQTV